MSWLIGQLWLWMALSGLLGFLSTLVMSTRRVTVERVIEVPVEAAAPAAVEEAVTAEPAVPEVAVDESPFPVLPGGVERPWEAEEEWSRPSKRAAFIPSSSATSASSSATAGDDWDDAAASWRDWADEATGRRQQRHDHELFHGEGAGSGGVPDLDASPFPAGAVDTPFRYDEPVDAPFPYAQPVEAPFPYAQPVDASPVVDDRERLEAERLETERLEQRRRDAERLDAERLAAELAETRRLEAERLEQERLEAERLEAERLVAERAEAERLEAERLEAERLAAERLEAQRLEAERVETERLERELVEANRLEAERLARLEAQLLEAERRESERFDVERLEAERADEAPLPTTPYGPGSAYAPFDGSAPLGFAVKGHESTKLFHTDRSRFFSRTKADVWFDSEDSARAAGFTRWDQRLTTAHHVGHPAAG